MNGGKGVNLDGECLTGRTILGPSASNLLSERGEDVGSLAAFEGKIRRVDERLAVNELNRYTATLEASLQQHSRRQSRGMSSPSDPDPFNVGAFGLEGVHEVWRLLLREYRNG